MKTMEEIVKELSDSLDEYRRDLYDIVEEKTKKEILDKAVRIINNQIHYYSIHNDNDELVTVLKEIREKIKTF